MKVKPTVFPAAVLLFLLFLCAAAVAQAKSYAPMAQALDALQSDNEVLVTETPVSDWRKPLYVFEPKAAPAETGFIFYPGGRIDPRAYAPIMRDLARLGFLTAIVPMPFDLAFFGSMRARQVLETHTSIGTWAVGGHSLGGVMACRFAKRSTAGAEVKGLVLWASYPSGAFSIANNDIQALSIYGTNDGLTTGRDIENSRKDLPPDAIFVGIEGGNHTQFGYYGEADQVQRGDNKADISRDEQVRRIIDTTAAFLSGLDSQNGSGVE